MTDALRVILEIGTKGRRVVAAATDWPGLDRWGRTEDDALEKLTSYLPRYTGVADRAGLADAFARQRTATSSSPRTALSRIGRSTWTPSVHTTPTPGSRAGPGRSSSSCAAPHTT